MTPLRVPDDELDYDDDLVYSYHGERFTGVGYDEAEGHGLSEISYVDGLQDGPARDWYPSGSLKSEEFFRKNIRHGRSREYREDGLLLSEDVHEFGVHIQSRVFDSEGRGTTTLELAEGSPNYQLLQRIRNQ